MVKERVQVNIGKVTWFSVYPCYAKLLIDIFILFRNVAGVQKAFLLDLMKRNASSRYGQDHHFSEMCDVTDFQRRQPLTKYKHYEPYIDAIYKGDKNVMSPEQPYVLAMTSGTSGKTRHDVCSVGVTTPNHSIHMTLPVYCHRSKSVSKIMKKKFKFCVIHVVSYPQNCK